MATDVSSIDDVLMASSTQQSFSTPATPEVSYDAASDYSEKSDYSESNMDSLGLEGGESHYSQESNDEDSNQSQEEVRYENNKQEDTTDEYGNEKSKPRTYTQEEVSELIRERLARRDRNSNQQPVTQQQQQTAQGQQFNYNPDSDQSWENQLEQFIENTVSKLSYKQVQQHQAQIEQAAEQEFRDKFEQGMERFTDFREVVGNQPITDPMTYALRGVSDPSAFIYAASKRLPGELERISKINNPYAQMVEMGKLEERMRKKPEGTRAPKPVSHTSSEGTYREAQKKKEPTIEEMMQQFEQKRLAKFNKYRSK